MEPDDDQMLDEIVTFAHGLTYADIPGYARQAAMERLLDSLGCALGALGRPEGCATAEMGRDLGRYEGHGLRGHAIGTGGTLSADWAAFVNSCLIRDLDFNDTYPGHHPSDCLGALVGLAATTGATLADLVTAMAVSYEVSLRLLMATRLNRKGWDNGYSVGLSTAAATARLLGLDCDQVRHAVALSATANVPMRSTRAGKLSLWKGAATAFAVSTAVRCVLLASKGMTGPAKPFTGRHGLMDLITGPFELGPFPPHASDFYLPRAKLKYWPVAYNIQPLIWLGLDLRARLGTAELQDATVRTNWSSWRESGSEPEKWRPDSRETADHSAPYVLCYAIRHGTIDHDAFVPASYLDESLRGDMARVKVVVDDEIEAEFPGRIRMALDAVDSEGREHHLEVVNVIGHEDNPMTRQDIRTKFQRLSAAWLGTEDGAGEVFDQWWESSPRRAVADLVDTLGRATDAVDEQR